MSPSQDTNPKLFTLDQAANILNVSKSTLRRWEREGKIKSTRTFGGHRRFTQEEINRAKPKPTNLLVYPTETSVHLYQGKGLKFLPIFKTVSYVLLAILLIVIVNWQYPNLRTGLGFDKEKKSMPDVSTQEKPTSTPTAPKESITPDEEEGQQKGTEIVEVGQDTVEVKTNWSSPPTVVTASTSFDSYVWVENITKEGFTLKLKNSPTEEQKIYWLATW